MGRSPLYDPEPAMPPHRRLTPEERTRIRRKLDALHDAVLLRPDLLDVAELAAGLRFTVGVGTLPLAAVPVLAELFARFGIEGEDGPRLAPPADGSNGGTRTS